MRGALRKLGWFALFWLLGVGTVALVAWLIRLMIL
jgi:hypothetical protein